MKHRIIMVYLIITLFLFCSYADTAAASDALNSFFKTDYAEDTLSKGLDPNVLFLLDVSTAMTFTPDGVMPNRYDHRTVEERGKLLKESTYGHGMRPPVFKGPDYPDGREATRIIGVDNITSGQSYSRYGRDLIEENNKIGDPYCYYTSDPNKYFLLTFRNRHLAHYKGWIDSNGQLKPPNFSITGSTTLPGGDIVGGPPTSVDIKEAERAYNALKDYIPQQYIRKYNSDVWVPVPTPGGKHPKPTVPLNLANEHLVPNDSRIYMMKLVLWRLTEEANAPMFTRMNVAAAMTFQDLKTRSVSNATRVALPGAKEGEVGYYGASVSFPYGGAASDVLGHIGNYYDINGVRVMPTDYSQWTARGVVIGSYGSGDPETSTYYKANSRAILITPFNKFYSVRSADASIGKTDKLNDFRCWISGYESFKLGSYINTEGNPYQVTFISGDYTWTETYGIKDNRHASTVYINQDLKNELFASSLTLLSTAIYGGQNSSEGIPYAPFHKGIFLARHNEYLMQFAVTSRDKAGASDWLYLYPSTNSEGLPTGQAIGSVFDFFNPPTTTNFINGIDGVNFADDSVGFFPVTGSCQQNWLVVFCAGNDAVPGYEPHEAVRHLFKNTLKMRGRRFDTASDKWVSEEYDMDSGVRTLIVGFISPDNKEPEVVKLKEDLIKMAKEGDPIEISRKGDPVRKFIPNEYALPEFANNPTELTKALNNILRRIYVEKMGSGNPVNQPSLVDEETNINTRVILASAYRMNNLDQWDGWLTKYVIRKNETPQIQWEVNDKMVEAGLSRRLFTSAGTANSPSSTVEQITTTNIETRAKVSSSISARFIDWVYRFNHSDGNLTSETILGDMVNSGITVVGRPRHRDLREDHAANTRDVVVYVQTNRGFLHAFNYLDGREIWGFCPPSIFQGRLRNMKTTDNGTDLIDGNGYTKERSRPMVLLDGLLIARDVVYYSPPRTLLTGYLGRGGNGFYAMDITHMDTYYKDPVFEWAIENPRYKDSSAPVIRWGKAASSVGSYSYEDLGLTIDPGVYFIPEYGGVNSVGVLPGGLGHKLGADSQGKVFYIFNPTDGSILWKIDSSITGFQAPIGRNLGMGVSPIIYEENILRKATVFYTADSEGNIFKCDTKEDPISLWTMKSLFQLRTLGTPFENNVGTPPPPDKPVVIPRKMVAARARSGQKWLFGGTSDIHGPESYENDARKIINGEQFLFGIHITNILEDVPQMNSGITPAHATKVRRLTYYADDIPAEYGKYGQEYIQIGHVAIGKGITEGMDDFGWVLRLRPKFGTTEAEYLTADPFMFNEILYFATFIARSGLNSEEACSDVGVAKLYMLDPSTGSSWLYGKPAMVLENIKIAGISGNAGTDRLTLSIKELKHNAIQSIHSNFSDVRDLGNGLVEVKAPVRYDKGTHHENTLNFEPFVPHIQYWRNKL